jgi:hypothetical protein
VPLDHVDGRPRSGASAGERQTTDPSPDDELAIRRRLGSFQDVANK